MAETVLFYLLASVVTLLAFVVVTQANPFTGALSLLGVLAGLAGLYALLSAPLVAVLQVLVYAGGILVLLVLVLMMLRLDPGSLQMFRASPKVLGAALGASALGLMTPLLLRFLSEGKATLPPVEASFGALASVASAMFGTFLFPFELLSFVLLSALVGALVLAKKRL